MKKDDRWKLDRAEIFGVVAQKWWLGTVRELGVVKKNQV